MIIYTVYPHNLSYPSLLFTEIYDIYKADAGSDVKMIFFEIFLLRKFRVYRDPNPNIFISHGQKLRTLGWKICALNTDFRNSTWRNH